MVWIFLVNLFALVLCILLMKSFLRILCCLFDSFWSWASVHTGMELLIGLLGSSCPRQQLDGAVALCKLANKAMALSPVDAAPPSPTPQVALYTVCFLFRLHNLTAKSLIFFSHYYHNHRISMRYLYMIWWFLVKIVLSFIFLNDIGKPCFFCFLVLPLLFS
jgi:hypothetical protein